MAGAAVPVDVAGEGEAARPAVGQLVLARVARHLSDKDFVASLFVVEYEPVATGLYSEVAAETRKCYSAVRL